jgi:hypothetical protein
MWNPKITLKYHVVLERWYKYYGRSLSGRIKVEPKEAITGDQLRALWSSVERRNSCCSLGDKETA